MTAISIAGTAIAGTAGAGPVLSWNVVADVRQLFLFPFMVNAFRAGTIVAVAAVGMIALALVVPRDPRPGLFFVTALSLNWVLAAGSYFLLPSLGPVYAEPGDFAALPSTGVSHLQAALLNQRTDFLYDPGATGAAHPSGRAGGRPGRRLGPESRRRGASRRGRRPGALVDARRDGALGRDLRPQAARGAATRTPGGRPAPGTGRRRTLGSPGRL